MDAIKEILKENIRFREQLPTLAKMDLKRNFSGSVLGVLWAVIKPAIIIFVFWFAFSVGLRQGADKYGHPYFLWLIAGMIPWFYMRDMINAGSNVLRKYKMLVTKIRFPMSTIPTFVSMSNLAVHMGLVIIMIIIFICFGYWPTIYLLELPLYMLMMFLFFTAWSLFSSLLTVVSKDFLNLVRSLTQALFWLSGILYDATTIDIVWIRKMLMFNPVTIVATGYRNVFITGTWFWEEPMALVDFGVVFLVMCLLMIWAYKKLKKVVPDVL